MNMPLPLRRFSACAVSSALSLCLSMAQSKPGPMATVFVTQVKPGMARDWEALQKELNAGLKKGGTPRRSVSQTAIFGDLNTYVSISPIENFAQFDGPSPLSEGLGESGSAQLLSKINNCVVNSHRYGTRFREDLSWKPMAPAPLSIITFIRVAPGKRLDYEKFVKSDILPAMKKIELDGYWVFQTVLGGDTNEYVTITPLKKFADLDAGIPLVHALGQAGADKVAAKSAGIITSMERIVSRARMDLSYAPYPASTPPKPGRTGRSAGHSGRRGHHGDLAPITAAQFGSIQKKSRAPD